MGAAIWHSLSHKAACVPLGAEKMMVESPRASATSIPNPLELADAVQECPVENESVCFVSAQANYLRKPFPGENLLLLFLKC